MFIDASALCGILTNEADAHELASRMRRYPVRVTSPLTVWETVVAVSRILDQPVGEAQKIVDEYLGVAGIEVRPVSPNMAAIATHAFERFGKGRHPAGLNFGDCFSYACARSFDIALLFKGNDFRLTDIEPA